MEEREPSLADRVSTQLEATDFSLEDVDSLLQAEDAAQAQAKPAHPARPRKRRAATERPAPRSERAVVVERYKQVSLFLSREMYMALRSASVERERSGAEPFNHEGMLREALHGWLRKHGFLDGKAR